MKELKIYDVRVYPGDSAFLIDDGETAVLYDSGFGFTGYRIADNIKNLLGKRSLDYILLTHSHYDHALGSAYIAERYPKAKIIAGAYASEVFRRPGAIKVMKELDGKIAEQYGVTDYTFLGDRLRADISVNDGDEISFGKLRLTVLNLPGHTKCSTAFYLPEYKLLLSCETLGVFNGVDSVIPSVLVGYKDTLQSIERVLKLDIESLLAPHLGLLSKEQTDFYLKNMKSAALSSTDFIVQGIKQGLSDEAIINAYLEKHCDNFTQQAYPRAAAELNTSIMVRLIRKEFKLQE